MLCSNNEIHLHEVNKGVNNKKAAKMNLSLIPMLNFQDRIHKQSSQKLYLPMEVSAYTRVS